MAIFKLKNRIQNYAWGSKTSMADLFGFDNVDDQPQAELWMGAHPNGCSELEPLGELLSDYISKNAHEVLGRHTAQRYGQLPFLFKVLAAHTPLSIQVHPNKANSERGFELETKKGVELDASNRNYKDPNHKPELVYAITKYKAMNGFRPIRHIISLFDEVALPSLEFELEALKTEPSKDGLKRFFTTLMVLSGAEKLAILNEFKEVFERSNMSVMLQQAIGYSQSFVEYYSDDIGILAPLILNIVELEPGEAMFLHAETPHAYVKGTALEIMASSDNVLRAGLTPKHIDVDELVSNTSFESIPLEQLKLTPISAEGRLRFPVPVDDFAFDVLNVGNPVRELHTRSAEILFCIEGEVKICSRDVNLSMKAGESVFIPCSVSSYWLAGEGKLARAYN
ncbi:MULTISPECIES: mannose-6-phosphate isomerase, class I [unclassified Vibrio]|uniref:mannose-6-phosphate isomerase, class I n=1 Tax=unclassified Vibrio TaxID=2614977 RepID=UPI00159DA542|nr:MULTISPECIES: mannose-6-phosphate isomerase, class I [unclassified Vibrio]NVN82650.1 mannose-6-phosphate isomerase, class I [Vibrio sp. Scap16]QLE93186.1 mannose-6-phosphate isomerase, class I [Vibrio sp. Scap24]